MVENGAQSGNIAVAQQRTHAGLRGNIVHGCTLAQDHERR
jgi:hypothetical protein